MQRVRAAGDADGECRAEHALVRGGKHGRGQRRRDVARREGGRHHRAAVMHIAGPEMGWGALEAVDNASRRQPVEPLRVRRHIAPPGVVVIVAVSGLQWAGRLEAVLGQVKVLRPALVDGLSGAASSPVGHRERGARGEGVDLALPRLPGAGVIVTIAQHIGAAQVNLVDALHVRRNRVGPGGGDDARAGLRQCSGLPVAGLLAGRGEGDLQRLHAGGHAAGVGDDAADGQRRGDGGGRGAGVGQVGLGRGGVHAQRARHRFGLVAHRIISTGQDGVAAGGIGQGTPIGAKFGQAVVHDPVS